MFQKSNGTLDVPEIPYYYHPQLYIQQQQGETEWQTVKGNDREISFPKENRQKTSVHIKLSFCKFPVTQRQPHMYKG